MPAQTTNLFLLEDLEDVGRTRRYDLKLWTGTLHESATYPPA